VRLRLGLDATTAPILVDDDHPSCAHQRERGTQPFILERPEPMDRVLGVDEDLSGSWPFVEAWVRWRPT
jgi:hypothetical protein